MKFILCLATLLLFLKICTTDELHSATSELIGLIDNDENLILEVKKLISEMTSAIELTKTKLHDVESEHELMEKDAKKYVENPLNSLLLIKRLTYDISGLHAMFFNIIDNFLHNVEDIMIEKSEFNGAVLGLKRLQDTYSLKSSDLAKGIIDDKKYRKDLNTDDLKIIGQEMIKLDDKLGVEYLKLAQKRNEEKQEVESMKLLKEIFGILKANNQSREAVEILDEILKIDPTDKLLEVERLQMEMETLFQHRQENEKIDDSSLETPYWTQYKESLILSRACSNLLRKSTKELSKLHCKMLSTSPFTKIAPFKIEIANLDPFIAVFHDILSNDEINILISLANELRRAEIIVQNTTSAVSKRRVAKLKFFDDDSHQALPGLTKRVSDMSGLNMDTAEIWQIQNYGIGGHYGLHHDYTDEGQEFNLGTGNRIATILFYLTDVEKGGATVFPLIKVYVPPKKGTAVFWWNLSTSGHRERLTRHAGCPVLVGSKTVVNKWLHEFGQEHTRPCELEPKIPDSEYYLTHYKLSDYGIALN